MILKLEEKTLMKTCINNTIYQLRRKQDQLIELKDMPYYSIGRILDFFQNSIFKSSIKINKPTNKI